MYNLFMLIIVVAAVFSTIMIAYGTLRYVWNNLSHISHPRLQVLIAVASIFAVHILNIILYAFIFYAVAYFASPMNEAESSLHSFADYMYFSSTTYSASGIGNIAPTSNLRLLAVAEALNGIVLIVCTIGFMHAVTKRFWFDLIRS